MVLTDENYSGCQRFADLQMPLLVTHLHIKKLLVVITFQSLQISVISPVPSSNFVNENYENWNGNNSIKRGKCLELKYFCFLQNLSTIEHKKNGNLIISSLSVKAFSAYLSRQMLIVITSFTRRL